MHSFDRIAELRHAIQTGKLSPGEQVGTEFAFSQEWGVARNTVRRRISTLIDEGLLERRPGKGLFVRAPHTVTRTIQLVVPDLTWSHLVKIARGTKTAGRALGVNVQVYDAHGDMEWDLEVVRQLPTGPTDGAILASLHHHWFSEVLFELKAAGYPFVLVDQRLQDLEVPTVEIDNYGGGYQAGKKIVEYGHRRVAFLGPMGLHVIVERLNGFRDALLDAGVLFDRSLVVDLGGDDLTDWLNTRLGATVDAVTHLLNAPDAPTAIVDVAGDVAPMIYRAVQQSGRRIPEDISVVTFDDSATFSQLLSPQVSQLKHDWEAIGAAALELLLTETGRAKRTSRREEAEHRVLPGSWVPGASLARPPALAVEKE
jgi:DNA-binding LacI/PurR family transcriptional regulator